MVFFFRSPTGLDPTASECRAVADAYGRWENTGFGVGYALLRGELSRFTRANAYSIGSAPRASFIDATFERAGEIPDLVYSLLPTTLAPIIRWQTAERGVHTGRTYAVGLTMAINDVLPDRELILDFYVEALATIFGALRATVLGATGYVQCHYTSSPRGGVGPGEHLLDITGSGCYNRMGAQRRRTRP
jgi:hypothetical protein